MDITYTINEFQEWIWCLSGVSNSKMNTSYFPTLDTLMITIFEINKLYDANKYRYTIEIQYDMVRINYMNYKIESKFEMDPKLSFLEKQNILVDVLFYFYKNKLIGEQK